MAVSPNLTFTDSEKLRAIELEIIRRKRMFGRPPWPVEVYAKVAVLKEIAKDYRAAIAAAEPMDRTDDTDAPRNGRRHEDAGVSSLAVNDRAMLPKEQS